MTNEREPIANRLDAMLRLMLDEQRARDKTIKISDQIVMLESTGLEGKEVAKVLGIDVGQLASYRRYATNGKRKKTAKAT